MRKTVTALHKIGAHLRNAKMQALFAKEYASDACGDIEHTDETRVLRKTVVESEECATRSAADIDQSLRHCLQVIDPINNQPTSLMEPHTILVLIRSGHLSCLRRHNPHLYAAPAPGHH